MITRHEFLSWKTLSANKWEASLHLEPRTVISLKATCEIELTRKEWQGGEDTGRCMTSGDQLEHFRSADKQMVWIAWLG